MAAVAALERMTRRGAVHCTSPGLAVALATLRSPSPGQPLSAYAGFDPTGPSLHLGHLAVVMGLRRLQAGGIRPIALVRCGYLQDYPEGLRARQLVLAAPRLSG